jgi:hypothetical protein
MDAIWASLTDWADTLANANDSTPAATMIERFMSNSTSHINLPEWTSGTPGPPRVGMDTMRRS